MIVPILERIYRPRSVVDVGCGEGWFASQFLADGVPAVGLDIERPTGSPLSPEQFVEHDLSQGVIPMNVTADMALCLEVAEHLPAGRAEGLVSDLCESSPVIVFSAAIPDQGGHGHVNERWQSYWAGLFDGYGYHPDAAVRDLIWHDPEVEPWYRQNIVVYTQGGPVQTPLLDVVHPGIYRWKVDAVGELDTILRWIEAGFPPWGCHHCRGAEYGPDGVPCPACHGHSQSVPAPPRAQMILERLRR